MQLKKEDTSARKSKMPDHDLKIRNCFKNQIV